MMRGPLSTIGLLLLLAGCSGLAGPVSQDPMENPLVAEQYEAELVDHFVNLQIRNDVALRDDALRQAADKARTLALTRAQETTKRVNEGIRGNFYGVHEETEGTALLLDDRLYFGVDFLVTPGGNLRVFVTRAVDPRDEPFPDDSAVDLGALRIPYGAQAYAVPTTNDAEDAEDSEEVRHVTVVIYDAMLKRIHGFAQLRP